jgi:hypothetical protein
MREQRLQFAQRLQAHNRLVGRVHVTAGAGVEHPHWDLDRMGVEVRRQTTANEFLIFEGPRAMDPDGATEPRMPAIAHLQRLGTMGVPLLACTTGVAATPRWARARRFSSSRTGSASMSHATSGTNIPLRADVVSVPRPGDVSMHDGQAHWWREPFHTPWRCSASADGHHSSLGKAAQAADFFE